jgi:hypothetical protein
MASDMEGLPLPGRTPAGEAALRLLLTRYSVSAKHLREPGPTDEELWAMAMAALRAPDHEKRIPFRFEVARGDALNRLADLFADYGRRHGKEGRELEREREKAMQAPVSIAVIARIVPDDPDVPVHEQWATVGGAITNSVNALHFMGYGAKMVAGARARDAAIVAAHCRDGETLVGWIATGTADGPATPRGERDPGEVLGSF